jgi:1,4-dihydroxy-2-naphthoate octaprenyltransferase
VLTGVWASLTQPFAAVTTTNRLSYKGLGEPLCFVAFGPLATTAFYLACSAHGSSQAAAAGSLPGLGLVQQLLLPGTSSLVALLSGIVGITTTVILFCSHWHQIQGDIAAGKRSPLVRLGTHRACKVCVGGGGEERVVLVFVAACCGS